MLLESFTKLLAASEDELPALLPDFRKMCAYSEHTFAYTQLVLRHLANETHGYALVLVLVFVFVFVLLVFDAHPHRQ